MVQEDVSIGYLKDLMGMGRLVSEELTPLPAAASEVCSEHLALCMRLHESGDLLPFQTGAGSSRWRRKRQMRRQE